MNHTFPGQGENPFIFAQTGSPIRNLWAVIALSFFISLKVSQHGNSCYDHDLLEAFSDHEHPESRDLLPYDKSAIVCNSRSALV